MNEGYVVIEDDRCYIDTPVYSVRGDCYDFKRQLIMTKEIFQECYKKWILEEQEQRTGRWIANGETFRCSECGELACCQGRYCNECGAKMQEVEE